MPDYKNKNCIIYSRISSIKAAQEGESLDTQEAIMRKFTSDRGLNVLPDGKVFREVFSGRKDKRPVLDEIFEYIENNPGKVNYFVFRVIDRFTRGGSYSYEGIKKRLAAHGVEMIDTAGIIQPTRNTLEHVGFEYEWSRTSPSEIAETVIANTAKAEVTNILTRMIGREIELTNQGFKIRQPADGFLNKKVIIEGKKKVIQVPDPERANYYLTMFDLRAAGTHSDKEIVKAVNAMGFRTKARNRWDKGHEKIVGVRGGHPLTVKQLQQIICRPIYCGVVCEKWTRNRPIKAQYDGLVSVETFNRANRGKLFVQSSREGLQILYGNHLERAAIIRTRNNPLFPYKNLVLCDSCRKPFTASCPRGKGGQTFPIYHCGRKHKYFGVSKRDFHQAFEDFVRKIVVKPEMFESLEAILLDRYSHRQNEILQAVINVQKNIADLKTEQKAKSDAFVATTSPVLRARLEAEVEELETQIKFAAKEGEKISITEKDISDFTRYAKYCLEHLSELLIKPDNKQQQASLFSLILEELPTYSIVANGTPKMAKIFTISGEPPKNDVSVPSSSFSWNTIEYTIKRWIEVMEQAGIRDNDNLSMSFKEGFG